MHASKRVGRGDVSPSHLVAQVLDLDGKLVGRGGA
jgi:hypothetical protein